jgi:hypothetical protein
MSNLVPVADVERMAMAIAKSGLFGMKSPEQAMALMLVAQAEGMHPAIAARDFHVIQGRPALKADAMLARFQAAGGKVRWISYTNERVAGVFSHQAGGEVEVDWTIAQAKAAGLMGKDVWRQYPRAMLRARVISEGIRTVFPGVAVGVYTTEEVEDMGSGGTGGSQAAPREVDMGRADQVLPDAPDELLDAAENAARGGLAVYQDFWKGLQPTARKQIGPQRHESYKAIAMQAPGETIEEVAE